MPRKPKSSTSEAPLAPIPSEILDQFVRQGPLTPEELDAVVRRFKKAIIERALGGELTHHLGYVLGGAKPEDTTNHRNGTSGKTVLTDDGPLPLDIPRDRAGTFEPRLIGTSGALRDSTTRSSRSMPAASRSARFRRFSARCTASTSRRI